MRELLETKFSVYNKYVAQELGVLAAVMLGELVSEYDYYKKVNKLGKDGSFYSSINNVLEATGLKRKNQEAAIKVLEDAGILIKIFNKEEGNKRYFKLNPYKIAEYTKYEGEIDTPLSSEDIPSVPVGHTLCPESTYPMSSEDIALSSEYNHKQLIITNNKNNNIRQTENFSNADASPSVSDNAETKLVETVKSKKPKKTKKQQRYEEIISSGEFCALLHEGITNPKDLMEIDTLWSEYIELRCSKDYRALTDGAVKRNLKVLEGTSPQERKAILEKSVTKGWTGLFPLNDYDKRRIEEASTKVEGSDEWIVNKMFDMNCKEREDEVQYGTTHNLIMELCKEYGTERVKKLYYERVKPMIDDRYSIKRDWKS